jgi:hypothetical protein
MDPPFALTRFIVSNSRIVSNCQSNLPSSLENARTTPSQPPEKTAPGIVVTAAELLRRCGMLGVTDVYQCRWPSVNRRDYAATVQAEIDLACARLPQSQQPQFSVPSGTQQLFSFLCPSGLGLAQTSVPSVYTNLLCGSPIPVESER